MPWHIDSVVLNGDLDTPIEEWTCAVGPITFHHCGGVTLKNRGFARGEAIHDFPLGPGVIARRGRGSEVLQIIPNPPPTGQIVSSDWVAQNECRFCYTGIGGICGGTWWAMSWDGEPDAPTVQLFPVLEVSSSAASGLLNRVNAIVDVFMHLLSAALEGASGQSRK